MAVSSASGSTSNSTSSIDVAGIVQQLMTVENRPLDALKAKITQRNTVISDLGTIKSKVSTLQEALQAFQDPLTFNTATATSSDATILGVSASNGALKGSYSVVVSSIALASKSTVSGYASSSASAAIDTNGFEITIAGKTFNTMGTPAGTPVIKANPSLLDLKNWINGLGQGVSANIVQNGPNQYSLMVQGTQTGAANAVTFTGITPSRVAQLPVATTTQGSNVVGSLQTESSSVVFNSLDAGQTLTIAGLTFTAGSSGATANQVAAAFASLTVGSKAADVNTSKSLSDSLGGTFTSGTLANWATAPATSSTLVFTSSTPNSNVADLSDAISSTLATLTKTSIAAQDANFTIDGNSFTRSTNSVNDVLNGVTFNLLKASATPQTVTVSQGADVSSSAIDVLIKSYNDVMSTYKDMTANINNSPKPGTFANSPTTLAFINQIKQSFAKGISYTNGGALKTMSLSSLGIDLQLDGTAKFNATSYATASANGLQSILSLGVKVGYVSPTSNLDTFLTSQVKTGGALDSQIRSENDNVRDLTKRQDDLQTRLNAVQNNLINQYSALNALLFQLNNTSTALTSALTALTNSQSKN